MDHFTKLLEELAKHLYQKQHFLRISMTKRVKNIATTEERNNTLWKTVSQGASFTPWRTFENSTCLSGTKIKQNWSDITGLVKHCCPPRLTLSHWRNEFPTYQLCSYPTTMEGLYLFKTHKFFNQKEKGTTFFPVTCLSIFQCQTPQLCSNLSSSYHPALSVRAVSKMTIKKDTNTTDFKTKERLIHHFTQARKSFWPTVHRIVGILSQ